jgi:hypothetical protein
MMAPSSGASAIVSSSGRQCPCARAQPFSRLRVEFGDVDRAPVAEQHHQDRQADRGLGRGHGQDEEHEHLARPTSPRKREKAMKLMFTASSISSIAHQQHDDVLAVDEDAGDADAEQHRAEPR